MLFFHLFFANRIRLHHSLNIGVAIAGGEQRSYFGAPLGATFSVTNVFRLDVVGVTPTNVKLNWRVSTLVRRHSISQQRADGNTKGRVRGNTGLPFVRYTTKWRVCHRQYEEKFLFASRWEQFQRYRVCTHPFCQTSDYSNAEGLTFRHPLVVRLFTRLTSAGLFLVR